MVELIRSNPGLPAALLARLGVLHEIPAGDEPVIVDSNLAVTDEIDVRPDIVTVHEHNARRVAISTEVQMKGPDREKRRSWPSYVTTPRVQHKADAVVLLVIALDAGAARACARPVLTGHPGFELRPVVIGPGNTPDPPDPGPPGSGGPEDPGGRYAAEFTVLGVLTGSLKLDDHHKRLAALQQLRRTDRTRRVAYTRIIRLAVPAADRKAMEDMMTTVFPRDDFIDSFVDQGRAEGKAEGEAKMLLQILAARGLTAPDDIRDLVLDCGDTTQLETWADRAVTAESLAEIFTD